MSSFYGNITGDISKPLPYMQRQVSNSVADMVHGITIALSEITL